MSEQEYDIIIVGASIAGGAAAVAATENGNADTLILEKRREIGHPIQCAEGLFGTANTLVPERFVDNVARTLRVHLMNGKTVELTFPNGVVKTIDRAALQRYWMDRSTDRGAELRTETIVRDVHKRGKVILDANGKSYRARMVIDASGPAAVIGTAAGCVEPLKEGRYAVCVQETLEHPDIDADVAEIWLNLYGGYRWSFPKGDGLSNVGLGVITNPDVFPRKGIRFEMDRTRDQYFPGARERNRIGGVLPESPSLNRVAFGNTALVGDAARTVLAHCGAGIHTGTQTGHMAGAVAARTISEDPESSDPFADYQRFYNEEVRPQLDRAFFLKQRFFSTKRGYNMLNRVIQLASPLMSLSPNFLSRLALAGVDYSSDKLEEMNSFRNPKPQATGDGNPISLGAV